MSGPRPNRFEGALRFRGATFSLPLCICDISPLDTDNIVKPIQDALVGFVFSDDELVTDLDCHRRSLHGTFDLTRLPRLVLAGIASRQECVRVPSFAFWRNSPI